MLPLGHVWPMLSCRSLWLKAGGGRKEQIVFCSFEAQTFPLCSFRFVAMDHYLWKILFISMTLSVSRTEKGKNITKTLSLKMTRTDEQEDPLKLSSTCVCNSNKFPLGNPEKISCKLCAGPSFKTKYPRKARNSQQVCSSSELLIQQT